MNPSALMPNPDPIPVAWGWFEGLNLLTFGLHIIFVNVLLGAGILALFLGVRERGNPAAKSVSRKLPALFALAVNLGVAPLLFLQVLYGHLFYTSTILSAVWWLAAIGLLVGGYYFLYWHQPGGADAKPKNPLLLALGVLLVLMVSLVMTNVLATTEHPELWREYFNNAQGTILNFFEPTTVPRYLHFLMASLALGGLFLGLLAHYEKGLAQAAPKAGPLGMRVFTVATMLQMAVGLWWFIALDRAVMLQFLGGNKPATGLFLLALLLATPTLAYGFMGKARPAAFWAFLTILAMAGLRAMLRSFTLEPNFSPRDLAVTGESSPLVLFLATLVVGLAVVAYMLRLAFRPNKEA